jgi:hypothetical protein
MGIGAIMAIGGVVQLDFATVQYPDTGQYYVPGVGYRGVSRGFLRHWVKEIQQKAPTRQLEGAFYEYMRYSGSV